ncbi:hypothetical protein L195_g055807, partial [Trifolium pratense]
AEAKTCLVHLHKLQAQQAQQACLQAQARADAGKLIGTRT